MNLILCGISFMIWFGTSFAAETPSKHPICSICHCNEKEKELNCASSSLFRLFPSEDWIELNATNKNALENIRFDSNGIEVITKFPQLNIRSLSFRHNAIRKIEDEAFKNLDNLESLDLSFNRLTFEVMKPKIFRGKFAPTEIEPMHYLKVLNLANNQLHSIDPDLFEHFPNLEELNLCWNPFTVIDHNSVIAISNIARLTVLDMSYMELKTLPEYIFHTPRMLKTLNLSGNLFKTLPSALELAISLVNLNFDDNILEEIGGNSSVFPALPKLETLSFSYMTTLKSIGSHAFSNLAALQQCHIQHNIHLSSIHPHAFAKPSKENKIREEWPPIRKLILNNNNLTILDSELIGRWDEIQEIDIRSNPWLCNCDTQWMIDTIIPIIKEKSPSMLDGIRCRAPSEMFDKGLNEIHQSGSRMRCSDYYGRHPENDAQILVGILIGLLIGIPIALTIVLIYKRGCFGIFGYGPNPNDYARAFYKRAGSNEDLKI